MTPLLRVLFLGFIISASSFVVSAQSDSIKVKVFQGTTPTRMSTEYAGANKDELYFVKLNYYLIGRGAISLGVERILHKKHAVSLDLGVTYRDYIFENFSGEDDNRNDNEMKAGFGKYVEVAYKFYPKDYSDFDDAFYMSPGIIYRDYKMTTNINGKDLSMGYKMNETYLKFGHVQESWLWDDVITDLYFGVGIRNITSNNFETINGPVATEVKAVQETKRVPALYMGVKIGFVF